MWQGRHREQGLRLGTGGGGAPRGRLRQEALPLQASRYCTCTALPTQKGSAGLANASIGDTVCAASMRIPLPTIKVEEPTVSMSFLINTSPFAGREGKYVTTRNIKDRLDRELERNLALKVAAYLLSRLRARYWHHLRVLCV
jgi:hypothetical protein